MFTIYQLCNFTIYNKKPPEDYVQTLKHVEVLQETDTLNIYCASVGTDIVKFTLRVKEQALNLTLQW